MDVFKLVDKLEGIIWTIQAAKKNVSELYTEANPFENRVRDVKLPMSAPLYQFLNDVNNARECIEEAEDRLEAYVRLFSSAVDTFREEFQAIADEITTIEAEREDRAKELAEKLVKTDTGEFEGELVGLDETDTLRKYPRAIVLIPCRKDEEGADKIRARVDLTEAQYEMTRKRMAGGECRVAFSGVLEYDKWGVVIKHTRDWAVVAVRSKE